MYTVQIWFVGQEDTALYSNVEEIQFKLGVLGIRFKDRFIFIPFDGRISHIEYFATDRRPTTGFSK